MLLYVEQLSFSNDGLAPVETEGSMVEPITKMAIPIPSLPPLRVPPLARACTLVGSFNLFVYGSIIYIGERISRDPAYGHSKVAYGLFAIGLLNAFKFASRPI